MTLDGEELLKLAIKDIKNGGRISTTAKKYGIDRQTLEKRVSTSPLFDARGFDLSRWDIPDDKRVALSQWFIYQKKIGMPTTFERKRFVACVLELKNITQLSADKYQHPEQQFLWWDQYAYPYFTNRAIISNGVHESVFKGPTEKLLSRLLRSLGTDVLREIAPENIYCIGQVGLVLRSEVKKFLEDYSPKERYKNEIDKYHITSIECISAKAKSLSSQILYSESNDQVQYAMVHAPFDHFIDYDGSSPKCIFNFWFKHTFIVTTRPKVKTAKRLIILKNDFYVWPGLMERCAKENVLLLFLTPEMYEAINPFTQCLLPALNASFDKFFKESGVTKNSADEKAYTEILAQYEAAQKAVLTRENIREAWKSVGLYPVNENALLNKARENLGGSNGNS